MEAHTLAANASRPRRGSLGPMLSPPNNQARVVELLQRPDKRPTSSSGGRTWTPGSSPRAASPSSRSSPSAASTPTATRVQAAEAAAAAAEARAAQAAIDAASREQAAQQRVIALERELAAARAAMALDGASSARSPTAAIAPIDLAEELSEQQASPSADGTASAGGGTSAPRLPGEGPKWSARALELLARERIEAGLVATLLTREARKHNEVIDQAGFDDFMEQSAGRGIPNARIVALLDALHL